MQRPRRGGRGEGRRGRGRGRRSAAIPRRDVEDVWVHDMYGDEDGGDEAGPAPVAPQRVVVRRNEGGGSGAFPPPSSPPRHLPRPPAPCDAEPVGWADPRRQC